METIGEIAAGGGSRGGGGVGRGELDGEEGRGLLTLLHEARTLLQVHRNEQFIPPLCWIGYSLSRLNEKGSFWTSYVFLVSDTASF